MKLPLFAFCLALFSPNLQAFEDQNTTFSLVPQGTSFTPGDTIWVAAHLEMNPDWHTYWEFQGDSGLATEITWTLPEGFEAGEIHWPAPYRFIEPGDLVSHGYKDSVKLMIPIQTPANAEPGETFTISAFAEWLECKDICLPGEGRDEITLTAGETPPLPETFEAVFKTLPHDFEGKFTHTAEAEGNRITIRIEHADDIEIRPGELRFFPLDEMFWRLIADFEVETSGTITTIVGERLPGSSLPDTLRGILVHESGLLEADGPRVLQIEAETTEAAPEITDDTEAAVAMDIGSEPRNLFMALILAFVAGIAINLLPCVFPVLGLKISGFMEQAHGDPKAMKIHSLVFAGGILVSLWILAAIVGALGAAWGAQFQDPRLVIALLLVLTLFTMNLFGLFEMGNSMTTMGGKLTQKEGYSGSFFQGVLMTVIATPCTGPFLAGMIGWMLTQTVWIGFLAFTSLGLGIALPYVVLAFSPKLTEKLPPPGMWMVTLKQGSAFAMVAFLWVLLYVLASQLSASATMRVVGAMMIICFAAWALGKWGEPGRKPKVQRYAKISVLLLVLFSGWLAFSYHEPATEVTDALSQKIEAGEPIRWDDLTEELALQLVDEGVPVHYRPFTPELLDSLRRDGRAVFIDFTAEWCTICKINKFTTLHREEVMKAFQDQEVVTLRADWTLRDDIIAEKLARHGRRGVPVYLLYGPGEDAEAQLLPERLNPGMIREYLDKL
ncbi:MAG: thioredoxin family protein [Verrucomicrobia bacterium]|nr:thioredoxin family protein [Verrucomicrobiota bacterium]MCH8513214.1 thioredoxin family protein [Kiritimatiellia bacterium]